jgi:hypothetical protein
MHPQNRAVRGTPPRETLVEPRHFHLIYTANRENAHCRLLSALRQDRSQRTRTLRIMTNFIVYSQAHVVSTTRAGLPTIAALLLDSPKSPVYHSTQLHFSIQCAVDDLPSTLATEEKKMK